MMVTRMVKCTSQVPKCQSGPKVSLITERNLGVSSRDTVP